MHTQPQRGSRMPIIQAPQASRRTTVYYEHIRVSGLPKERGRQYGKQAAAKIRQNIAHYMKPGQLPPWERTVKYINDIYVPGLKEYFPSALEEMEGIAEGSGVTVEEIIMLNARYDLSRAPGGSRYRPPPSKDEKVLTTGLWRCIDGAEDWDDLDNECTSSAFWQGATAGGGVYTAQNWDISSHLYENDLVIFLEVHPDPSENAPSMFLVTEAGQMGRSGMNSAGLGLTSNSLNSTADYFPEEGAKAPRLPISLLRRLFLQEKSFPKALQAVYHAPRHVSNNLTLSTAEGFALCMEITPNEAFVITPTAKDNHIIHSNHFLTPAIHARTDIADSYPGGSSWFRHVQFEKGVLPFLDGGVDADVITKAFSDHLGYPQSLCEHVDTSGGEGIPGYPFKNSMTVACVVYDLTRKVITVCKGPPCQGVFEKFKLDGSR
ncbi:acyl-coenzyme A:6-aminopenicillanic acid acyl-transferase-domain-containing protein [Hypoxylon rubiginosum]|uniref:Acyl-coenzyme A:6-aminopenicillanic acid acyl-transferase-domain-containing protein n=1 Tax=Hypoxylon rubiginosum TaxID=110542 RepID=A0ACC0CLK7_9PEZI|nr:acyl-coenzyme A:6-aminopenicillanic acid acyl-transferase-domain-containing protein [Hypoxylon rubiginosum]